MRGSQVQKHPACAGQSDQIVFAVALNCFELAQRCCQINRQIPSYQFVDGFGSAAKIYQAEDEQRRDAKNGEGEKKFWAKRQRAFLLTRLILLHTQSCSTNFFRQLAKARGSLASFEASPVRPQARGPIFSIHVREGVGHEPRKEGERRRCGTKLVEEMHGASALRDRS